MTAGAGDFDSAENAARQAVLAMPGWDYPVRVRGENGRRAAAVLSSLGALAGVAGWAASTVPFLATAALPAAVLAALFFAIALGAAVGVVPIAGAYRARRIRRTRFPAPLLRVGLVPRAPHGSHQMVAQDGTVARVPEHGGDYPVSRTAFVIGPLQAIALAAPHAGAASGAGQSKLRVAPPALRERVGPMLGVSDGEAVYLSERDRYSGCFMSGGPGSGKTLFLLTLWGYDAFNRARCSGPAGGNAMIWFDTKMDGEAATAAARLSKFGGDKFVVIRVGDPTSQYGIEMLPRVGSAAQRGRDLAAIFKSVFGEQAIAFQSQMTLQRVFTAGFAISECPALVAQVPGLEPGRSPIWYADVLLSNRGSHMAVALFQALQQAAINGGYGADVEEAFQVLQPMFELSEAKRIDLSSAPRSKTDSLMLAEHWWSRPVRIPWEQILTQKAAVVIDFGGLRPEEGETGAEDAQAVLNTELRDALAAMMLHTLRVEIERVCAGWFRTEQAVSIYADEVKHLAGADPDTIAWFRNDARAFGVRASFATQFAEQLVDRVRQTLLGFGTVGSFAQGDPRIAGNMAAQFELDGSDWSATDLAMLGRFEAAVTTMLDNARQPTFTTRVAAEAAFALDADGFARLQGFDQ
ncbi:hypothetical protein [Curtobacterium sp. 20TX0008]|uniref:hypothetical protein n=1 Tax=Curtobacterium sp. 20TX0008 TaxID=3022018 RepID=UPI00232F2E7F|nr:hypothetical protein [Curtobacterium sp. 20TX0008]MDB6425895.1 hypothetical protein [Curtobacterium sp. 20TX0008]